MKILLFSEFLKEENKVLIQSFLDQLSDDGIEIVLLKSLQKLFRENRISVKKHKTIQGAEEFKQAEIDMVITLGGDGTILSASKIVRETGVPILGVNLGRLGFLSSVEKTKMPRILKALRTGTIKQQKRSLLKLSCNLPLFTDAPFALNDFTLHKRDTSSMVTIHAYVNDKFLNSYWADGLIVSTPTGSTGYSLSCGGPIVFPGSGNFVITPIAPHNLNVRPIVLSDTHKITLRIEGRTQNFLCTLDSRFETVTHEHIISIEKNDFEISLATLDDVDFMKTIRNKLMWGLDKRN